jgi:malonate transporter and related proteins
MPTFALLLPDIVTIALGFVLFKTGFLKRDVWDAAEKLVYFVLFPALLFTAVAKSPLDPKAASTLILASLAISACGIAWGWLARPLLASKPAMRQIWAGCAQTAFRFNSYVALSLASRLDDHGQAAAFFALIIAFNVPLCNAAAVIALASQRPEEHHVPLWKELASNPLILATVGGLVFKLLGLSLPDLAWTTLQRLGQAALVLGLMAVGAGLSWSGAKSGAPVMAWMLASRTLVLPAIAWTLIMLLPLDPLARSVLIVFAALPTASSAYILATRMGAPGAPVAAVVSIGTLLSVLALPFWLGLSK